MVVTEVSVRGVVFRNPDDDTAWWVTGRSDSFWFWVVYKSTIGKQVRLQKIAGDHKAEIRGSQQSGAGAGS